MTAFSKHWSVRMAGALVLALLVSCSAEHDKQPARTGEYAAALVDTNWRLVTFNGIAPMQGTTITLTFTPQYLRGSAGCNAYGGGPDSGQYAATTDGQLFVGVLANTARDCPQPEGVMAQERAYLAAFHNAATYQLTEDRLIIRDNTGQVRLEYVRQ